MLVMLDFFYAAYRRKTELIKNVRAIAEHFQQDRFS